MPASRCSPGSSRSMSGAGQARARARSRRRLSPPARVAASELTGVSRPRGRQASQGPRPARSRRAVAWEAVTSPRATRRFSRTVVSKTCASSAVRVTCAATSWRAAPQGATPLRVSVPARGSRSPARVSSRVVLPTPEGPTTARRLPGRSSRSMPRATTGPPGQPTARSRATRTGPPSGAGRRCRGAGRAAVEASADSTRETMRTAAPAEATSWALAGPRALVASKAARGTSTVTASMTGSSVPEATAGTPTARQPRTARPMARVSTAAARAAGRAARSRARARRPSRSARPSMTCSRRPLTASSPPPSATVMTVADSSVACSARASSAARAARTVAAGPTTPASRRQAARTAPAGGWTSATPRLVAAPTTPATHMGR